MAVHNDTTVETPQPAPTPAGPGPVQRFLREVTTELKKTHWPTRDELTKSTVVVLATIVLVACFLYVCDYVAGQVMTHVGITAGTDLLHRAGR